MLPVTYLRSSSIKSFLSCPLRFWAEYCIGLRSPLVMPATIRGSAFHSAMKVLAEAKRKTQCGSPPYTVHDPDTGYSVVFNDLSEVNSQDVLHYMAKYYIKDIPSSIVPKSYKSVSNWIRINDIFRYYDTACLMSPKSFNVLDMDIWGTEIRFSLPLQEQWAKYDFVHCGKHYEGQLRLEGSIDLIYNDPDRGYTILDWKSGMVDKSQTDEGMYDSYCQDIQLKMYYLAAKRYFRVPVVQMTICQVNTGKSFTVLPCEEYEILNQIRDIYEQMKATEVPKRSYSPHCIQYCSMVRNSMGDYQSTPKVKTRTYLKQAADGTVSEAPMSACLQMHNYFAAGNSRQHIEDTLCRTGFDINQYFNE